MAASKSSSTLTPKDLREAPYNPRFISDKRLGMLQKSIAEFGDLSGVVFNRRTKMLISGHQRMKTIKDCKTRIETKPDVDKHGTVETGFIIATTKSGSTIKIPLRIVDWSDKKREMAANVAANAQGGDFDKAKLKEVLSKLEHKTFDVELLGLDPLTIQALHLPGNNKDPRDTDRKGTGRDNQSFSPDDLGNELEHECPRCRYRF